MDYKACSNSIRVNLGNSTAFATVVMATSYNYSIIIIVIVIIGTVIDYNYYSKEFNLITLTFSLHIEVECSLGHKQVVTGITGSVITFTYISITPWLISLFSSSCCFCFPLLFFR